MKKKVEQLYQLIQTKKILKAMIISGNCEINELQKIILGKKNLGTIIA
jgi:hypothetical protein